MSDTCYRCGVNAWTSCKHREVTRQPPPENEHKDRREKAAARFSGGGQYAIKPPAGNGRNFKGKRGAYKKS